MLVEVAGVTVLKAREEDKYWKIDDGLCFTNLSHLLIQQADRKGKCGKNNHFVTSDESENEPSNVEKESPEVKLLVGEFINFLERGPVKNYE